MVHANNNRMAVRLCDRPGGADGIAHVAADNPVQIRTVFQDLLRELIGQVNGIHIIFHRHDLHILILGYGILRALCAILMAGRADAAHKNGDLSPVAQPLTEGLCQICAVLIIVRISDISDSLTAFGGVRTGKRHNLRPGIHHLVQNRGDDLFIRYVYANYIIVSLFRRKKPPGLILGGSPLRGHILVRDGYPLFQKLSLRLFHSQRYGVPPRVHRFIGKIKIIMILLRNIGIQDMVKIYRARYGFR